MTARECNGIEVQFADLGDRGAPGERGLGARYRNVDVARGGNDAGGPQRRRVTRHRLRRPRTGRAMPALAREIAERGRAVARHHHADVVERRIGLAAMIDAPWVGDAVRARIPAAAREIIAAHERKRVVDDDHLLMMRRADRMAVVEAEGKAAVRAPVELVDRQPLAFHRVEHREVPRQHVAVQVGLAGDHRIEEFAERLGQPVVCAIGNEAHPAVDIPTEDQDRAAGAAQRRTYGAEVLLAIDEKCQAFRALDAPAVASGSEHARRRERLAGGRFIGSGGKCAGVVLHA